MAPTLQDELIRDLYRKTVRNVNEALKNVKHLSRKTKAILEDKTTNYTNAIKEKNYILTSKNHLAAMLIKTMLVYVDQKYNKKDKTKAERLIKLISRLKNGSFELKTAKNILKTLEIDNSKFGTLLLKGNDKDFKKICDNAKTILKNVDLEDLNKMLKNEFDESKYPDKTEGEEKEENLVKDIIKKDTEITNMTKGKGLNDPLPKGSKTVLKSVLTKIISVCKNGFKTIDELKESISKLLVSLKDLTEEKNYLQSVVENLTNTGTPMEITMKKTEEDAMLNRCHKDSIRLIYKTKLAIDEAYAKLTTADTRQEQQKTRGSSPLSSEPKTPNDMPQLGPVETPKDTPPRPIRPAPMPPIRTAQKPRDP